MIFLELLFGIPLALAILAFAVTVTAFLYPRFARWLEARTVPRWPRTEGWFYDATSEIDEPPASDRAGAAQSGGSDG